MQVTWYDTVDDIDSVVADSIAVMCCHQNFRVRMTRRRLTLSGLHGNGHQPGARGVDNGVCVVPAKESETYQAEVSNCR